MINIYTSLGFWLKDQVNFICSITLYFFVINQKPLVAHMLNWLETAREFIPEECNDIYYPTKDQIISLHDYLIEEFQSEGEPNVHPGLLNDGPLEFTGIKYYEKKGKNKWEDIIHRGARLLTPFWKKDTHLLMEISEPVLSRFGFF